MTRLDIVLYIVKNLQHTLSALLLCLSFMNYKMLQERVLNKRDVKQGFQRN